MIPPEISRALLFIIWACACQLSGSYLLWDTARGAYKSILMGLPGGLLVFASAIIMSLLPMSFGLMYALYAGILAMMALLWGWHYTKVHPGIPELIGTAMIVGGISVIFLAPKS